MKIQNQLQTVILLLLISSISSLSANEPVSREVKFNKVCMFTTEGEHEWVEFYNATDSDIDIAGWTLQWKKDISHTLFKKKNFFGLTRSLVLKPKDVVVFTFDGSGREPEWINDSLLQLFSTKEDSVNILDDTNGFLLLRNVNNQNVDFVKWSSFKEAKTDSSYIPAVKTDVSMVDYSYRYSLSRSASGYLSKKKVIGLIKDTKFSEKWITYKSHEVPFGLIDSLGLSRTPWLYRPGHKQNAGKKRVWSFVKDPETQKTTKIQIDKYTELACENMGEGYQYQFQVFSDSTCQDTILESDLLDTTHFPLGETFVRSINRAVYWRARMVIPVNGGIFSKWSELRVLMKYFNKKEYQEKMADQKVTSVEEYISSLKAAGNNAIKKANEAADE